MYDVREKIFFWLCFFSDLNYPHSIKLNLDFRSTQYPNRPVFTFFFLCLRQQTLHTNYIWMFFPFFFFWLRTMCCTKYLRSVGERWINAHTATIAADKTKVDNRKTNGWSLPKKSIANNQQSKLEQNPIDN